MTDIDSGAARPLPWGYFSTLGWALVAVLLSGVVAFVAVLLLRPESIAHAPDLLKDGPLISLTLTISIAVQIGVLALAVRLAQWPVGEYLGLVRPSRRDLAIALVSLMAFALAFDAVTYLLGREIVTPFQVESYRSTRDTGALSLLWFVAVMVIAAPVGEEIVFRGFLFRGWVRPGHNPLPAILAISALFAIIHSQYDWFGILQVFFVGLILGWARWRSGSTALTILMHALINLWATAQTMVKVEWLP